jgi:hypothetical protein
VSVGQVMAEKTVQEIPLNGRHFVDLDADARRLDRPRTPG